MTDNTEPTIDTILQTLCDYVYNAGELAKHQGIFVGGEPKREALEAIERIISDQVAKARIEETSLWYNEWGNGTDEIGDGSWEDYYAHRIQTLNGVKNK